MNSYELTERGKIIIAVVLVIVLLVIPTAIILGVSTCSGASQPNDNASSASPSPPETVENPVIADTPLPPNGSGFDPSDNGTSDTADATDSTPSEDQDPTEVPKPTDTPDSASPDANSGNGDISSGGENATTGPVGLNLTAGTMQFLFSPDEQDALDEDTVEMLKDFLSSPKNTRGSRIKVEMPDVGTEDEAALKEAVVKAFSHYNITEVDLVYAKSGERVNERFFEVELSFIPISNQK